jgi:hypothetical protein
LCFGFNGLIHSLPETAGACLHKMELIYRIPIA